LLGERSAILAALPSGLGALLGGDARRAAPAARPAPEVEGRRPRWLWALAALAGVFVLWALLRGGDAPPSVATREELPPVAAAPPASADLVRRTLPDGAQISVPRGSLEDALIASIQDPSRPLDDRAWIDFDRLLFASGSAQLEPSSRPQLRNVASILVAYPALRAKVGAYTDDTGDDAANLELSRQRAENVRGELVALGVPEGRLEAEGYGEQHPVAPNDTEEGRARNRRISLLIVER
jgi:outer membrane protein OmpA-like peptidoglycan-associated protein